MISLKNLFVLLLCCSYLFTPLLVVLAKKINKFVENCRDRFPECVDHLDDCDVSPGWMTINCPKACNTCHLQDPKIRCNPSFLNVSTTPIVAKGDMDRIFGGLLSEHAFEAVSTDPWIVQKDAFLSSDEIDELLAQVEGRWERSHESGEISQNGEGNKVFSEARTSSTFWCIHQCQKSAIVQRITERIQSVLTIPSYHYEPFQLLKYGKGEKYITHHDYSFEELRLACGPRILTVFLYLSDVEEGGETNFPSLQISVTPKKGKVVVWSNTLTDKPLQRDERMSHEAKAVLAGNKFAANVWVHALEWERPSLWACTGAETTM